MKPTVYVLYIILGFIFGLTTLIIGFAIDWVFGQDVDCMQNMYPCSEKEIPVFKRAIHNSAGQNDSDSDNDTVYCHQHFANGTVMCHEMKMSLTCFDNKTLADKYAGTENYTIPCPPFKMPHQEDESGK